MKHIRLPSLVVFAINIAIVELYWKSQPNILILTSIIVIILQCCIIMLEYFLGDVSDWLAFKLSRTDIKRTNNPTKSDKYKTQEKNYGDNAARRIVFAEFIIIPVRLIVVFGTIIVLLFGVFHFTTSFLKS